MIEVPIFHVNGEDPEAVVFVGELALDFRQTFGQDVVIDMVCYRRHGHNEGDEPAFTQPLMYEKIKNRISIRELYTEQLVMAGELSSRRGRDDRRDVRRQAAARCSRRCSAGLVEPPAPTPRLRRCLDGPEPRILVRAGRDRGRLRDARDRSPRRSRQVPAGFTVNPKLARILAGRRQGDGDEGDARLGLRRDAGLRLAARREHPGPPERPGQPPRHLQPAARRAGRHEDRRARTSRSTT